MCVDTAPLVWRFCGIVDGGTTRGALEPFYLCIYWNNQPTAVDWSSLSPKKSVAVVRGALGMQRWPAVYPRGAFHPTTVAVGRDVPVVHM